MTAAPAVVSKNCAKAPRLYFFLITLMCPSASM